MKQYIETALDSADILAPVLNGFPRTSLLRRRELLYCALYLSSETVREELAAQHCENEYTLLDKMNEIIIDAISMLAKAKIIA